MSGLSCLDSETFSCWVSLASFCFSLDQLSLIQPSKGPKSFLYLSSICFLLFLSKNNFDFIDSFLIFYLNRNPLPALVFELWRGWKSMFMLSLLFAQQPAIFLLTFWVCLSVNYLSICFSVEFLFLPHWISWSRLSRFFSSFFALYHHGCNIGPHDKALFSKVSRHCRVLLYKCFPIRVITTRPS